MKNQGDWKTVKLGDVCRVIPGYAFKSKDWCDSGIPVIKIKNIQEDRTVNIAETDHVPELAFSERLRKFVLGDGDILLVMTGATAGKVGRLKTKKPMLLNQRVAKILPVDADPDFIWAVTSSEKYQSKFFYLADGAAQPNMSGGQIEGVELNLPSLPTQRKIAGILSAYDDLIENNLRRIKILEEMAQSLYREWFVHFRFPRDPTEASAKAGGHESVKFVDSALGQIPEGWEVRKILDFAEVIYGFAFKAKHFNTAVEGVPVVRIRNIQDGRSDTYTEEEGDPKHRIRNGDILVGMDGDFHMTIWSGGDAWQNQRVAKFRPKGTMGNYLLFLALENPVHYFDSTITGTTVAHLGDSHIRTIEFAAPPGSLMRKASELLEPLAQAQLNLRRRNQTLRQTRDLLLPNLLSGEDALFGAGKSSQPLQESCRNV